MYHLPAPFPSAPSRIREIIWRRLSWCPSIHRTWQLLKRLLSAGGCSKNVHGCSLNYLSFLGRCTFPSLERIACVFYGRDGTHLNFEDSAMSRLCTRRPGRTCLRKYHMCHTYTACWSFMIFLRIYSHARAGRPLHGMLFVRVPESPWWDKFVTKGNIRLCALNPATVFTLLFFRVACKADSSFFNVSRIER